MESALRSAEVQQLLAPQTITGTTTTTLFDAKDVNGTVDFLINLGACTADGSNKFAIAVKHSDTTAAADLAAVAADDILLDDLGAAIDDATSQQNKCHRISVNPRKRYLALVFTETGTASAVIAVTGLGGAMRHAPDAATAVGTATT